MQEKVREDLPAHVGVVVRDDTFGSAIQDRMLDDTIASMLPT
jgi:hypothetical protein